MKNLFKKKVVIFGKTRTTIEDQKELESLGMSIKKTIYFENGLVVYEGFVNKYNNNLKKILTKFPTVPMKK